MKKIEKHSIYNLCGIFIFTIVILSNFLKMHYAQDTYHLQVYGLGYTAINAFLYSGRPITAIVFFIADFLNLTIEKHVIINTCFSIVNLSLTVFVLSRTIISVLKKQNNNINEYIIIITVFFSIFNFCTMDLLVFAECGILTMGLLFSVIAGCQWAIDKKNKYLRIFIFSLIGVLCYQGILNIYVPISLMFIIAESNEEIKKSFKHALIALTIYGIALITSMIITNFICKVIMIETRATIIPTMASIISTYLKYIKLLAFNTLNIGPKYWYIIVITMISLFYFINILKNKYSKIYIFFYFAIIFSSVLLPIMPLIIQDENKQYLEPRMCMSFGASVGIIIIYILLTKKENRRGLFYKSIEFISIIMFVINCQYVVLSSSEMIATNLLDRNIGKAIIGKMENYESKTNIRITKIGIDYDSNLSFYYDGANVYRCLNLKSMATDWAIEPIIEIYGNRRFKNVKVSEDIHKKYFEGKNWNAYSEEQIQFEGDTMYICIY